VLVNKDTLECSVKGVYVVGDGLSGPATVVEAIRDAKMAAEGILGAPAAREIDTKEAPETIYGRKGILKEEDRRCPDSSRCLNCDSICENCVEVCPNRANISVRVPGMSGAQIIHVDYMCNECGNCKSFCPYESAPYLDKFTLFACEKDFENSKNSGFMVTDLKNKSCKLRLEGVILEYKAGESCSSIPKGLCDLISAVISDYDYLLSPHTKR